MNLTERDRRTLKWGGLFIAGYLVLFSGLRLFSKLESVRKSHLSLVNEGNLLREKLRPYEAKLLRVEKMRSQLKLEPSKLKRATLVAEASAAIQTQARSGGIMLGPLRETAARPNSRELTNMSLEASGPPQAIITFLHQLETLGFPLLLETIQIGQDTTKPGMVKLNLTMVIMDFENWKTEEEDRNA